MCKYLRSLLLVAAVAGCTGEDTNPAEGCGPNAPCSAGFVCEPKSHTCQEIGDVDVDAGTDARAGVDARPVFDARPGPDARTAPDAAQAAPDAQVPPDAQVAPDTVLDVTPPSLTTSRTATFAFHADRADVTFACSLDGGAFATCASPASFSNLTEGTHGFAVRALAGGLVDASPASFRWSIDRTPPDTTIVDAPAADVTTSKAIFTFTCSAPPCDFACSVDGGAFAPCASPATVSPLAHGPHTFAVRAEDEIGNTDPTPATHDWFVHLVPPVTTILTHPDSPQVVGGFSESTFTFTCSEKNATVPCRFTCTLDGAVTACASPKDYPNLFPGTHSFTVQATDAAGLTDPLSATFSWDIIEVPR